METKICSYPFVILLFDSLLGLVIYVVLTLSSIILPCVLCCKHTKVGKWILNWTETVVEHVFDNVLEKHRSKEGENIYTVSNYKAPRAIYTTILSILLIQMVAVAAIQFCDDFFIEESHKCTTNGITCCYISDLRSGQHLNCSSKNYSENKSITCYRFVSNLGTATGNALGVVTTTALVIYLLTLLLLKVSTGKRATTRRKCCTITIQIIVALSTVCLTVFFCWLKFVSYSSLI